MFEASLTKRFIGLSEEHLWRGEIEATTIAQVAICDNLLIQHQCQDDARAKTSAAEVMTTA